MCYAIPFSALKNIFFDVDIVANKQMACSWALSVLLSTTCRHHSSQNVVDWLVCALWVHNVLTTFDLLKSRYKNQHFDTPALCFDQWWSKATWASHKIEKELLPVINSSGLKKGFSHMKHVITSSNHLAWWVKHIYCCNLGKRITSQLRSKVSIDKLAQVKSVRLLLI